MQGVMPASPAAAIRTSQHLRSATSSPFASPARGRTATPRRERASSRAHRHEHVESPGRQAARRGAGVTSLRSMFESTLSPRKAAAAAEKNPVKTAVQVVSPTAAKAAGAAARVAASSPVVQRIRADHKRMASERKHKKNVVGGVAVLPMMAGYTPMSPATAGDVVAASAASRRMMKKRNLIGELSSVANGYVAKKAWWAIDAQRTLSKDVLATLALSQEADALAMRATVSLKLAVTAAVAETKTNEVPCVGAAIMKDAPLMEMAVLELMGRSADRAAAVEAMLHDSRGETVGRKLADASASSGVELTLSDLAAMDMAFLIRMKMVVGELRSCEEEGTDEYRDLTAACEFFEKLSMTANQKHGENEDRLKTVGFIGRLPEHGPGTVAETLTQPNRTFVGEFSGRFAMDAENVAAASALRHNPRGNAVVFLQNDYLTVVESEQRRGRVEYTVLAHGRLNGVFWRPLDGLPEPEGACTRCDIPYLAQHQPAVANSVATPAAAAEAGIRASAAQAAAAQVPVLSPRPVNKTAGAAAAAAAEASGAGGASAATAAAAAAAAADAASAAAAEDVEGHHGLWLTFATKLRPVTSVLLFLTHSESRLLQRTLHTTLERLLAHPTGGAAKREQRSHWAPETTPSGVFTCVNLEKSAAVQVDAEQARAISQRMTEMELARLAALREANGGTPSATPKTPRRVAGRFAKAIGSPVRSATKRLANRTPHRAATTRHIIASPQQRARSFTVGGRGSTPSTSAPGGLSGLAAACAAPSTPQGAGRLDPEALLATPLSPAPQRRTLTTTDASSALSKLRRGEDEEEDEEEDDVDSVTSSPSSSAAAAAALAAAERDADAAATREPHSPMSAAIGVRLPGAAKVDGSADAAAGTATTASSAYAAAVVAAAAAAATAPSTPAAAASQADSRAERAARRARRRSMAHAQARATTRKRASESQLNEEDKENHAADNVAEPAKEEDLRAKRICHSPGREITGVSLPCSPAPAAAAVAASSPVVALREARSRAQAAGLPSPMRQPEAVPLSPLRDVALP